jgi:hypothetical protein
VRANSNLKMSKSRTSNSECFCLEDKISLGLHTREESSKPTSSYIKKLCFAHRQLVLQSHIDVSLVMPSSLC